MDDLSKSTLPPPPSPADATSAAVPANVPKKGRVTEVGYDKLVIAVGAYSQTFGIEGVRQHAHFLRDVGDAKKIRLRVLSLFEQCMSPSMCKSFSFPAKRTVSQKGRKKKQEREESTMQGTDPDQQPNRTAASSSTSPW